jgi:hypothetical protein
MSHHCQSIVMMFDPRLSRELHLCSSVLHHQIIDENCSAEERAGREEVKHFCVAFAGTVIVV